MSDSTTNVIIAAISAIGTRFGIKFLEFLRDSKKEVPSTYKDLLIRVEKELTDLKAEYKNRRDQMDGLKTENNIKYFYLKMVTSYHCQKVINFLI
jgi:hypothetical protein